MFFATLLFVQYCLQYASVCFKKDIKAYVLMLGIKSVFSDHFYLIGSSNLNTHEKYGFSLLFFFSSTGLTL